MCGEKCATRWQKPKALGSPPRMRGKAVAIFRQLHHGRITPAYAGKSDPEKQPGAARWDHPRVCGEKKRLQPTITAQPGSPPRMRGKGAQYLHYGLPCRITPAYAGKSSHRPMHSTLPRNHPRVCGEKTEYRALVTAHQGSPPRMRGKVFIGQVCIAPKGITPAYAGKRFTLYLRLRVHWDHPRVCGEKFAT